MTVTIEQLPVTFYLLVVFSIPIKNKLQLNEDFVEIARFISSIDPFSQYILFVMSNATHLPNTVAVSVCYNLLVSGRICQELVLIRKFVCLCIVHARVCVECEHLERKQNLLISVDNIM